MSESDATANNSSQSSGASGRSSINSPFRCGWRLNATAFVDPVWQTPLSCEHYGMNSQVSFRLTSPRPPNNTTWSMVGFVATAAEERAYGTVAGDSRLQSDLFHCHIVSW